MILSAGLDAYTHLFPSNRLNAQNPYQAACSMVIHVKQRKNQQDTTELWVHSYQHNVYIICQRHWWILGGIISSHGIPLDSREH